MTESEYQKLYYKAHRDEIRAKRRKRYAEHRDEALAYNRAWKAAHRKPKPVLTPEQIEAQERARIERRKEYMRAYHSTPEYKRGRHEWYMKNRAKQIAYNKAYYAKKKLEAEKNDLE